MYDFNNHLFNQNYITTLTIIIAIVYVSIIYIILGLFLTYNLDKYVFYTANKDFTVEYVESTHLYLLILNILLTFSIISIIVYLVRNCVQIIPFPFNFANIDYHGIREVFIGPLLIVIMITFSQTLNEQYKEIKYKLNGKIY